MLVTVSVLFLMAAESAVRGAYTEPAGWSSLPVEAISAKSGDCTSLLQGAVDRATAKSNGGRILLRQGTYSLNGVVLKSNVHLEFEAGTVVVPYASGTGAVNIFEIGSSTNAEVQNVSFRGVGGKFFISYPSTYTLNSRSFAVNNVNNLLIRDIHIAENYTKFSAIAFLLPDGANSKSHRAKNVTATNLSCEKTDYGYSLIQANAGQDMLFTDLISTDAGVTVRVETDLEDNNIYNIGVDNIVIQNVTNVNGHAVVFMQPHSISNGVVTADGVVAIECGIGVAIFKNIGRFPGLPDGTFSTNSYIRNISVLYGTNTPMNYAKIKYMPPSLSGQVYETPTSPSSSHRGPSVAAVINLLPDQVDVNYSDITHSGPNLDQYLKIVEEERRYGSFGLLNWDNYVSTYGIAGLPSLDSDGDGRDDWGEYVLGGNPKNAADLGIPSSLDAETGRVAYSLVGDRHLVCNVLTRSSLGIGGWETNATLEVFSDDGLMRSYTNSIDNSAEELFIKLVVE